MADIRSRDLREGEKMEKRQGAEVTTAIEMLPWAVGLAIAFGAWCIRVELRLSRERQWLLALQAAVNDLRRDARRSSESLGRQGEMLAAIKATVDLTASALRDMSLRIERLGERAL
jgi:hypothetical protein